MRYLVLICLGMVLACDHSSHSQKTTVAPNDACSGLFGVPNERTSAEGNSCTASCGCFEGLHLSNNFYLDSPRFDAEHLNPLGELLDSPYTQPHENAQQGQGHSVCAIAFTPDFSAYELSTRQEHEVSASLITHTGPCGRCSSLQDLKVYAVNTDLTDPVRQCGIMGITSGKEANIQCLKNIGFSKPCASIWYYNTVNTREECLDECLANLNSPYVDDNGELNECLACDEEKSGPIFKQLSGRTRRNSAIPSAICRPCSSISRLSHDYLEP